MGTRALLLAGAMALGMVSAAAAADLPLPPPPTYIPPPPPPEPIAFGGWYIRGDVGVGISNEDIRSSFVGTAVPGYSQLSSTIADAAFVDAGVGYQFNNWFRMDATGEYRTSQAFHSLNQYDAAQDYNAYNLPAGGTPIPTGQFAQDEYNGQVQSSVFLVNAYADLGTWYGFTTFVGGGIGVSYNHLGYLTDRGVGTDLVDGNGAIVSAGYGNGFGHANSTGKFDLAYAGMAGISYAVNRNLKLELSYRYLDMGTLKTGFIACNGGCGGTQEYQRLHLSSNDIRIGMRWLFDDYVPPAPPPELPIIRKD